jgi:CHAT domain-containing protein
MTINQLEQLIRRTEPIELLTLSACQTAVGDDQAALGLAGIALKAGARSALASLWFVEDEATTQLISEFYQQLHRNQISKAKALQNAQKHLLAQPRYRHPALWASFLLIGNWL